MNTKTISAFNMNGEHTSLNRDTFTAVVVWVSGNCEERIVLLEEHYDATRKSNPPAYLVYETRADNDALGEVCWVLADPRIILRMRCNALLETLLKRKHSI